MKPRQRLEQKQSSRMYLRRKDHRDVIMNDIYHNAIWMNKEQDGEQKDELVWCKYPKKSFLFRTNHYSSTRSGVCGWFDIDRQIAYGRGLSNLYSCKTVVLNDYVVLYENNYSLITKDGVLYKKLNGGSAYRYKDNSLVSITRNGNTIGYTIYSIVDFEDDLHFETETKTSTGLNTEFYYVCPTENGCIIVYQSPTTVSYSQNTKYNHVYYELTDEGAIRLNEVAYLDNDQLSAYGEFGINYNNMFYCCYFEESWRNNTGQPWKHDFTVYWTRNKNIWEKSVLWSIENNSSSHFKMFAVLRGAWTYFYCITNNEMKVFKTVIGDAFEEVELPDSIIVDFVNQGGEGIENSGYETFQLKLKPSAETDADFSLNASAIVDTDFRQGIGTTFFVDGENDKWCKGLVLNLGNWVNSGYVYYTMYIEGNEFEESENNIIFKNALWVNPDESHTDRVVEGDYVIRNKPKEREE